MLLIQCIEKKDNLTCTCLEFAKTDGLCAHVVSVAEMEGFLECFVSNLQSNVNVNKVLNNTPKRGGDKPKQKKRRRGRNNVCKTPIVKFKKMRKNNDNR